MVGRLQEAVEPLSVALDHALDNGDTGTALFACAALGRLRFAFGDQHEVDRLIALGAGLVDRLGDLSNPVLQYLGFTQNLTTARDPHGLADGGIDIGSLLESLSPDLAWLRGMSLFGRVVTAHADHGAAAAEAQLSGALDATAGVSGGSPNFPFFLGGLAMLCGNRGLRPDPRIAERLERDVFDRGFYYLEADPTNGLGVTTAASGDMAAATRWFELARESAERRGNRVARALTVRNHARAEFRNGFPSGQGRFDELIAEAREHFGALVGFEPRVAELAELVAARDDGRPLPIAM
jgi:hypothetical protein